MSRQKKSKRQILNSQVIDIWWHQHFSSVRSSTSIQLERLRLTIKVKYSYQHWFAQSQTPTIVFRFLFQTVQNGDIIPGIPVTPEDHEDLSEYKFQKFATTYFQGNVGGKTWSYSYKIWIFSPNSKKVFSKPPDLDLKWSTRSNFKIWSGSMSS